MALRRAVLALVAGVVVGCSPASVSPGPSSSRTLAAAGSPPPSLAAEASPRPVPLPAHEVIPGPDVAGAFDMATDGAVVVWSNGTIDHDAAELWVYDPARAESSLAYRSTTSGAILANLAVRHSMYAFAEVTPRAGGSRTWRLLFVDARGAAHVLDTNDVPADQAGVLPMAAISDIGVLWATSHAGDATSPRCELRYASLADLKPRVTQSAPCAETEVWYPRSDGRSFVYGTVEYDPGGGADERHVYLVIDADLAHPRRLDTDGAASMPAILGDTVVWKAAPPEMNMLSPAGLVQLPLTPGGAPSPVPFPSLTPPLLTTPTIGSSFLVGEDTGGGDVTAWDRVRGVPVDIDRLQSTDPGFVSGTRLAGDLLAWFYTSTTGGGGTREIRWLTLRAD